MPKTKISEYSVTNSSNTDIEGINIDEGCAPSGINNAIRELMVHLKEFQTGASGDAFTFAGGVLISGTANTITGNVLMSGTVTSSNDITVNGVRVGEGAGSVATNTALGASALAANTTGANNTAVGAGALDANTTGDRNTAVGKDALGANTTGRFNTAFGYEALLLASTASGLTAIGYDALYNNTTGANNVAVGFEALVLNTTGSNNTAVGYQALDANTTGQRNTGLGDRCLSANTTASDSTAIGYASLFSNTTGANNTALGSGALFANTTGANNTAVGYGALDANTTGVQNTAVGQTAGGANTTGSYNAFIGEQAGLSSTTGSNNSYLGWAAGYLMTTGSKNVIVGSYAGNQDDLDIRTASNYAVISDGDGNRQATMKEGSSLALDSAVPQTGTGITFPATQNASSNANTLDDYEEGTWTPAIRGSGTAGTYQLSTATGNYVKIGKQVTITCLVIFASSITGGGSGYLQITGIPIPSNGQSIGAVQALGLNFTTNYSYLIAAPAGSTNNTTWFLSEVGDDVTANDFPISGVTASDVICFTNTYFV